MFLIASIFAKSKKACREITAWMLFPNRLLLSWGISATYKGDIQWFLNNTTILMRLYETDCYEDFKIKEKEGEKLTDLANLFLSTINDKEFKSKYEEEKQAKKKKYEDDIYK